MKHLTLHRDKLAFALMSVLIAIVLISQIRLLYVFPQPDGARWWGDESGQILELRAELVDGHARIPTALGSTLAVTNGLARGNSWLAAFIYGIPALLFHSDIIAVGRSITILLSLVLLFAVWKALDTLNVSKLLRLLGILIIVSSRSFFFASHAARLDIAAGMIVMLYVSYLAQRYNAIRREHWKPGIGWWFLYGAVTIACATISIHLLTLLGLLSIFVLWKFEAYKSLAFSLSAVVGVICVLLVLLLIYFLSGAPVTLFGRTAGANQFRSVVDMLPILRPFSRSVQTANIAERMSGLWNEAPTILLFSTFALICRVVMRKRLTHESYSHSFFLSATVVVIIAWLLFQSPALYYYMHIIPVAVASAILLVIARVKIPVTIVVVFAALLSYFAAHDTVLASQLSTRIDKYNSSAISGVLSNIHQTSRPLVLAQNPAVSALLQDTSIRVMTTQLVSFPADTLPLAAKLRALHVDYILLYATSSGASYSDDYRLLRPVADSCGSVVRKQTGVLCDIERHYFRTDTTGPDTLILYKLSY